MKLGRFQRCPVCIASRAMIQTRDGKTWRCRGCGSSGFLMPGKKHPELAVACAASGFDYSGRQGIRERLVKQIRTDTAKALWGRRAA